MPDERTVLVVEDEVPLMEAIRIQLEKADFQVVTARSVDQALNHLKDIKTVDAIWLDHYLLGKENGLDFVAQLKSDGEEWKHIPIFVVSNTASENKIKSYLQLGVEKYYTKSDFRLDDLIAEMSKYLDSKTNE